MVVLANATLIQDLHSPVGRLSSSVLHVLSVAGMTILFRELMMQFIVLMELSNLTFHSLLHWELELTTMSLNQLGYSRDLSHALYPCSPYSFHYFISMDDFMFSCSECFQILNIISHYLNILAYFRKWHLQESRVLT